MENKLFMNTQYIDFYLQGHNMTKTEFSKKCDITLKELNDVYAQKDVNIFVILNIVKVLRIKSDTFLFRDKGYPKRIFVV